MAVVPWIGAALVILALADMYTIVLVSRADPSLLGRWLHRFVWRMFRQLARTVPRSGSLVLSYAGPTLVVLLLVTWSLLVIFGFALIFWPALGTAIQASHGPTPTDFAAALYYSGVNFTTLGMGDLAPTGSWWRLLSVLEALLGFSVLTSAVSFILSIYEGVVRRNTFARMLHYQSGATGDAVELLVGLGADGRFDGAPQQVGAIARELFHLVELHHTYPTLHYFRFAPPQFALAQMLLLAMDMATLGIAALDARRYAAFIQSSGMRVLWHGGRESLEELSAIFLPSSDPARRHEPSEEEISRWQQALRWRSGAAAREGNRHGGGRRGRLPSLCGVAPPVAPVPAGLRPLDGLSLGTD